MLIVKFLNVNQLSKIAKHMFQDESQQMSQINTTKARVSPKLLVPAIESLSIEQRKWVKATGLGYLLHFKLKSIPYEIGWKLLWTFAKELDKPAMLLGGNRIEISEYDVARVLGLPR